MLAKLRKCIKRDLLKTVCVGIFDSILRYAIQVWGQHKNQTVKQIKKFIKQLLEEYFLKQKLNQSTHFPKN